MLLFLLSQNTFTATSNGNNKNLITPFLHFDSHPTVSICNAIAVLMQIFDGFIGVTVYVPKRTSSQYALT